MTAFYEADPDLAGPRPSRDAVEQWSDSTTRLGRRNVDSLLNKGFSCTTNYIRDDVQQQDPLYWLRLKAAMRSSLEWGEGKIHIHVSNMLPEVWRWGIKKSRNKVIGPAVIDYLLWRQRSPTPATELAAQLRCSEYSVRDWDHWRTVPNLAFRVAITELICKASASHAAHAAPPAAPVPAPAPAAAPQFTLIQEEPVSPAMPLIGTTIKEVLFHAMPSETGIANVKDAYDRMDATEMLRMGQGQNKAVGCYAEAWYPHRDPETKGWDTRRKNAYVEVKPGLAPGVCAIRFLTCSNSVTFDAAPEFLSVLMNTLWLRVDHIVDPRTRQLVARLVEPRTRRGSAAK
jgi:hypothetical protein